MSPSRGHPKAGSLALGGTARSAKGALVSAALELRTERLRLRPFAASDHQPYAAMCGDAEVMRHIGAGGPISSDDAWRQMAGMLGHWLLLGCGMWAVELATSGELIGRVGFIDPPGWPVSKSAGSLDAGIGATVMRAKPRKRRWRRLSVLSTETRRSA